MQSSLVPPLSISKLGAIDPKQKKAETYLIKNIDKWHIAAENVNGIALEIFGQEIFFGFISSFEYEKKGKKKIHLDTIITSSINPKLIQFFEEHFKAKKKHSTYRFRHLISKKKIRVQFCNNNDELYDNQKKLTLLSNGGEGGSGSSTKP